MNATTERQRALDGAIKELFHLDRYKEVSRFDFKEWLDQLERRKWIESFAGEDALKYTAHLLTHPCLAGPVDIRANPTVEDLDVMQAWAFHQSIVEGRPDLGSLCERWWRGMHTTHGVDFDLASESGFAEWREFERKEREMTAPLFDSYDEAIPRRSREYANLQVYMEAPDDVIVESFKRWLSSKRKSNAYTHAAVRKFTPGDLAEWSSKRVLAYIDLTLLANLLGARITAHKMGDLLFPEYSDIDLAERIRKTVAPTAKKLMSFDFQESLRQIAALDR